MVDCVNLRVEMQTATSKLLLADIGRPTLSLVAGDTLDATVHHEIKELRQHVLAYTVSYQLLPCTETCNLGSDHRCCWRGRGG